MNPTLEEVKKVAIECGSSAYAHPFTTSHYFSDAALQAFAQHYKEEGRKEQREIDEKNTLPPYWWVD